MSIEAMKQAIEEVRLARRALTYYGSCKIHLEAADKLLTQLVTEAEKQKPVAWMYPDDLKRFETNETFAQAFSIKVVSPIAGETVPLYTHPPKREWVGLTDEQIANIAYTPQASDKWDWYEYARAIEAKFKEKNT